MIEPPLPTVPHRRNGDGQRVEHTGQIDVDDVLALPGGDLPDQSPDGHDAGVGTRQRGTR